MLQRMRLIELSLQKLLLLHSNYLHQIRLQCLQNERVLVRNYEVIYEMFDEVEEVLNGMSEPTSEEVEIARAKIKQVFTLSDGSTVYGAEVTKGLMLKGYRIKIERNVNNDIYELGCGKITSLRIKRRGTRS